MYLVLRGIELRYALTMHLLNDGPASINEMIEGLLARNFSVRGRASKAVSDALRWEIERGRVYRLGRGRYGPADVPRSTEYRIRQRVLALRAAADLSRRGGQIVNPCSAESYVAHVTNVAGDMPELRRKLLARMTIHTN
jgi:hypothetical protein